MTEISQVELDGVTVGLDHPPYVIAEIGANHLADIEEAKKLIDMAAFAGAQAVKFQKRNNRELYTEAFYNSAYNSENAYRPTYGEHRDYLEFSMRQFFELQSYAREQGITFIATPFDISSVDFLEEIGVPFYKVASGSITNPLLLRRIASIGKPVVCSLGGADWETIQLAVDALSSCPLVLLHCVAEYPIRPATDANISRIERLAEMYPQHVIGFSDHDDGIMLAGATIPMGARVFEKHITRDRTYKGTDHAFSVEIAGLMSYIKNLNEVFESMKYREQPFEGELGPIRKMGSAVYLNRDMKAGEIITENDLILKSPMDGLPGWTYDEIVGKRLIINVNKEQQLGVDFFDWEE